LAVPEEAKAARAPKIMPGKRPEAPEEARPRLSPSEEILSSWRPFPERRGRTPLHY